MSIPVSTNCTWNIHKFRERGKPRYLHGTSTRAHGSKVWTVDTSVSSPLMGSTLLFCRLVLSPVASPKRLRIKGVQAPCLHVCGRCGAFPLRRLLRRMKLYQKAFELWKLQQSISLWRMGCSLVIGFAYKLVTLIALCWPQVVTFVIKAGYIVLRYRSWDIQLFFFLKKHMDWK